MEELEKEFKLFFKNVELTPAITFLQNMKLKATDSRQRTKLVNELLTCHEELVSEQMELIEEYGARDDNNELIPTEDGVNYLIASDKMKDYIAASKELMNEKVVINGGNYIDNIKKVEKILLEYDGELSGKEAEIYDIILDEFEKNNK